MHSSAMPIHDIAVRAATAAPYKTPRLPIEERARIWMDQNPQVYAKFAEFTHQLLAKGHKHIGAKLVGERLRWESLVSGNDGYKVNNDYLAYMGRRFMEEHPIFGDIFRLRATNKDKAEGRHIAV